MSQHRPRRLSLESGALPTILAGIADGDVGAFAALYDQTCALVYGLVLRVMRDPTSAQQATQEVYRQVWATAGCFDPSDGSAQAWLTTLTHRLVVDRVRAEPCRAARSGVGGNGNRVGGCHDILNDVRHHMVGGGSEPLHDRQRETIALAYYGALTYNEVAEFLNDPVPTVTSRLRDGLTRLAQAAERAD